MPDVRHRRSRTVGEHAPPAHDHRVQFYDHEAALERSVLAFLRPALHAGVAIVFATPAHRERFGTALTQAGIDVTAARDEGRLVLSDAAEALDTFVADDLPDSAAFEQVMGRVLDRAAAAPGEVRIYGEMVALLWEQGNVAGTMALEGLWNHLAARREFALLCGYPSTLFEQPASRAQFDEVCSHHTAVVVPESQGFVGAAGRPDAGRPDHHRARWRLPADLSSGAEARRRLRALLSSWRLEHLLPDVELLSTELVNNALVHARSEVTVRIARTPDVLRVEVTDVGDGTPRPREPELKATAGRGLRLVEALSDTWGTELREGSKTVWFEVRTAA